MQHQKKNMNNSLFISKASHEVLALERFCELKGINLIAESLIKFEAVPFSVERTFEVIFFTSIRSAHFFLKQETVSKNTAIACIGLGTAEKLQALGLDVSFVGDKSGNPSDVAQEFKKWLGKRIVLFPQSTISKRSIVSILPENQCLELTVYNTLANCKEIPHCETYVFTSPSNFESFLLCNNTPQGKIIAWGESTKKCIEKYELPVSTTLEFSNLNELTGFL